ncbi:MAG TPA: PspC domain-containing protein [Tissierellaceae bacterium]
MSEKKLYKSNTNKMVAGVCGGIGEYLNVDPTVIRLLAVFLSIGTFIFGGVAAYIIAAIIIPENPVKEY